MDIICGLFIMDVKLGILLLLLLLLLFRVLVREVRLGMLLLLLLILFWGGFLLVVVGCDDSFDNLFLVVERVVFMFVLLGLSLRLFLYVLIVLE